jgi:hypothetical protein
MAKIRALVPSEVPMYSSIASPTTKEIQAVGDVISYIALAEEDAVINRVIGYVDVLTGTPGIARIGLQTVTTTASTTVTFTATTTTVNGTFTGSMALTVGQAVVFTNAGGALPAAITSGTTYFVLSQSSTVITIGATPSGSAITFATAGTGTHTVTLTGGLPSQNWIGYVDLAGNGTNFTNFNVEEWTLTNTASITRGQYYALVIQAYSGTWDGSNRLRLRTTMGTGIGSANNAFPYTYNILNGVPEAKGTGAYTPNIGCGTSTRQYKAGYSAGSISSWNSGSTPNQRGIKFKLPSSLCTTFKVAGVRMAIGPTNAAAQWTLKLLDSSNTVLQDITYNNFEAYNTNSIIIHDYYFDESTLTALSPNTDYRIVVEAISASLGCMTYIEQSSSVDISSAFIPDGTFHLTTRTGSGAWTDTTTAWFPMQLIIDDFTASGGGGGTTVYNHVGMTGGIRG